MYLGSGIRDPGSGKNLFRIPDPGVKKAPDPGSGSATLASTITGRTACTLLQPLEDTHTLADNTALTLQADIHTLPGNSGSTHSFQPYEDAQILIRSSS